MAQDTGDRQSGKFPAHLLPGQRLPLETLLPLLPPRLIKTLVGHGFATIGDLVDPRKSRDLASLLPAWQLAQVEEGLEIWPLQYARDCLVLGALREEEVPERLVPKDQHPSHRAEASAWEEDGRADQDWEAGGVPESGGPEGLGARGQDFDPLESLEIPLGLVRILKSRGCHLVGDLLDRGMDRDFWADLEPRQAQDLREALMVWFELTSPEGPRGSGS